MRLKGHLEEMAVLSNRYDWLYPEVLAALRRMGRNDSILWRGWGGSKNFHSSGWMVKVSSEREGYKGKIFPNVEKVISSLKLEGTPVFTTRDYWQAGVFGLPYAVVPIGSFKATWNPDVYDLVSAGKISTEKGYVYNDEVIQKIVVGYKTISNDIPNTIGEVILIVKEYWLVSPSAFVNNTKGKFKVFQKSHDIKTYGDMIIAIETYLKYYKWWISKKIEENPGMRKTYAGWGIPEEWLG